MDKIFGESDIVKKAQRSSFKLNPIAAAIAIALSAQFGANLAHAGSGFGKGVDISNQPVVLPTYYASSPVGPVPALNAFGTTTINPATGLPVMVDTGKALRKFVDTLPGLGATKMNNLGQYIPVAVPEKWVDLNGSPTNDDYYEIAAIEFTEKMHSDLPKATRMRGYVQLSTATNPGLHIALTYPDGTAILDTKGAQVYAYDHPHHLGPVINSTKGTAVRVKFTNYLPVGAGGELFIPVDTTVTGAGLGPDGVTSYTQNRAEIHLVGGHSPWISAGTPHQWVAPAGEAAAYAAGMGKGVSALNVPDMADPGNGSTTLYFPNDLSARFMFYQDRSSGLTRLNSYAGLEAGYFVTDDTEQGLIANGVIPAEQIPLIIEDKTFVPSNIAQQDAKWDINFWGQPGDLWFPHVYEPNQDPNSIDAFSPVGRWDFGPLYWPIFPASGVLPSGAHGDASLVLEAFLDTPVVNGTAYPTLTVDPKAYRFRILNASNDRYLNLSLFKADPNALAPQLDKNGNPIVDANGVQQYFTNTEVKMVPAIADAAGNPVGWDANLGVQLPLPQYPNLKTNINVDSSGPSRAWPKDQRVGGTPDPTMTGPDFIVIGNDGGLLPNPVDVPAQPVTYEANRRSITVGNIYGYGLLMGPAERVDAIVDFSAYAGQTLIVYNDAPAQNPWNDPRNDYYTDDPDLTDKGGTYSTKPGYGPNTRTIMQIKVNAAPPGAVPAPFNADALVTALPAAYAASQPKPFVPASAYNAAFGTNDTDIYARLTTGTVAQPNLEFSTSANGAVTLTGLTLITSGGTVAAGGVIAPNPIPGSGTGYDPLNPPVVVFNNVVNGADCLSPGGVSASATAVVEPTTHQVSAITNFNPGSGYVCVPTVTFTSTAPVSSIVALQNGGSGYTAPTVVFSGGGGTGATATATVGSLTAAANVAVVGGSGYAAPAITVSGGGVAAGSVTGSATLATSAATVAVVGGSGYTAPTITVSGGGVAAGSVTGSATVATSAATVSVVGGSGYTTPAVTVSGGGVTGVTGSATVSTSVATVSVIGGSGYTAPTVTVSGGGVSGVTGTATVGTSVATVSVVGGSGYTAPTVTVSGGGVSGVTGSATVGTSAATVSVVGGSGYTAPTVTVSGGGVTGVTGSATIATSAATVSVVGGSGYTAPAVTVSGGGVAAGSVTGSATVGTSSAIVSVVGGSGYTAPTVTVGGGGVTGVSGTAIIDVNGVITDIILTPNAGFTSAPSIAISDATGIGASATATVDATAGAITGITLTPNAGFTSAPTIAISDATGTGASATATLATPVNVVTGITVTNPGTGYTSAPAIEIQDATGSGAVAVAKLMTATGVGARVSVGSTNMTSYPVLPKAEQELFDAYGRYNFTGGVEIPLINAVVQTTIPLNYTDSATEIIGDNEIQVWKLVDNGFWANPIHFDSVEVQLINRVGWDGTVKPPASTELGWKDTVTLNQLEDVIVAVRAKRASVPFGLPQSKRTQDPSLALGAAGTSLTGGNPTPRRFTVDPGVVQPAGLMATAGVALATTTVNTNVVNGSPTGNYDNEFAWGSASLGHAENDFIRPIVFNPTVIVPAAPGNLNDPTGTGTMTWTDPTPAAAATTLANVQNEIGFKMLRADLDANGNAGAYAQVGSVPANVTSWTDPAPVPNVSYVVVAYNAAGDSAPSASFTNNMPMPVAPTMFNASPVTYNSVTLNWSGVLAASSLEVWRHDVALGTDTLVATLSGTATIYADNTVTPLKDYTYQIKAINALGTVSSNVLPVSTPMVPVAAPTGLTAVANATGTAVTVRWTDNANNETLYRVDVAATDVATGVVTNSQVVVARSAAQQTAINGLVTLTPNFVTAPGNIYNFTVTAVNVTGGVNSTSAPVTVVADLSIPTPAAPLLGATTITAAGRPTLNWTAVPGATGYLVSVDGGAPVAVNATSYTFPAVPNAGSLALGSLYNVTVTARVTKFGVTNLSVPSPLSIDLTPAVTPELPAGVTASLAGTTVTLNWGNVPNATSYLVQVSTNGGAFTTLPAVSVPTTTATVTAGNTYVYQVAARTTKAVSNYVTTATSGYAASNMVTSAPAALAVPANLAATVTAATGAVSLSWRAVNVPAGSTVAYQLVIDGTPVTVAASPYVPVPALALGVAHTVTIASQVTRNGLTTTSAASAPITVDLTAAAAPIAPASATATTTRVTWPAATGISPNATVTYVVTRSVNGGAYVALPGSPFTVRTANVTSVAGNTYSYQVQALATRYGLAASASAVTTSNTVDTRPAVSTTPVAAAGALGSKSITLSWTNTSSNITGFTVQRRLGGAAWAVMPVQPAIAQAGTTYSFTDTGLAAGSYRYRVMATSAGGSTGYTASSNAVVAP